MKPQDVIEQLIGTTGNWEQIDTFNFQFDDPEKFPDFNLASVDLDKGIVVLQRYTQDADGQPNLIEEKEFAIKAELVEITPAE